MSADVARCLRAAWQLYQKDQRRVEAAGRGRSGKHGAKSGSKRAAQPQPPPLMRSVEQIISFAGGGCCVAVSGQWLHPATGGDLAACPPATRLEAIRRSPRGSLVEFYGSTEGQFTICPAEDWLEHPDTVGRARAGRRLFTRPLEEVPDDEGVGLLWCEAPSFARFEYFGDPAATAAAWSGDAFSVGDLGGVDEEGWVTLVGRRQELIISGGVNVYPVEVETALLRVEGVREAGVVGLDDEDWGQRVVAAVVLSDPELPTSVVAEAIAATLAPYKRPKQIFVLDELPHGVTGKLQRRELASLLAERR